MRIAVTGGSGRIGRAIIRLALEQGHTVVSIDRVKPPADANRHDVPFIELDTTDYEGFEKALRGCDALIHMAAIPSPGRYPDHVVHNNNVVGSYNALRAAAEVGISRVCQASSVNATGLVYSRWPKFDYFPLDEEHPTYNEDPYSLSKWICEQQADSFVRRYESMTISSLRFHWVIPGREVVGTPQYKTSESVIKNLWGYVRTDSTARACLLGVTAPFKGHEAFYIVAPETITTTPSLELKERWYPDVPVRGDLSGNRGFFDCRKAERLLGWKHNEA